MPTPEEARAEITENLISQAMAKHGPMSEEIRVVTTKLLLQHGNGPIEIAAVALALLRVAAAVTYGTVETPVDMQVRTTDEFGALAASMWSLIATVAEDEVRQMTMAGIEPEPDLAKKVKAVPSDETLTPSTMPKNTVVPRRHTLDDLLDRISNSPVTSDPGAN